MPTMDLKVRLDLDVSDKECDVLRTNFEALVRRLLKCGTLPLGIDAAVYNLEFSSFVWGMDTGDPAGDRTAEVSTKELIEAFGFDPARFAEVGAAPEIETNDQFVNRIMNFNPHGALVQALVIEAIKRYADDVSAASAEELDTPFLSGAAWKAAGEWVKAELAKKYG